MCSFSARLWEDGNNSMAPAPVCADYKNIYYREKQSCSPFRPSSANAAALSKSEAGLERKQQLGVVGSAPEPDSPLQAELRQEAAIQTPKKPAISPSGALPVTPPHGLRWKPIGLTPLPLPLSPAHRHKSSTSSTSSASSIQRPSR